MIDGGTTNGATALLVTNVGGGGAATSGEGIHLVEAINGGTTAPDAFSLAGRAAAGAYEYYLFRGGGSTSADDWFLRSSMAINPGGPNVALLRPEVPLYAPIPAIARHMGLATLGTLHERVGEEMNIRGFSSVGEIANGAWGRVFGASVESSWTGGADSRVRDARLGGIQAGLDLYRAEDENGHRNHVGLYGAYTNYVSPSVSGSALGQQDLKVGGLALVGPALGGYWTHFGPSGWYLDAVVQGNVFEANATSLYSTQMTTAGTGFTAFLEGGYPIALKDHWQIEPQAQIVYQAASVNSSDDAYSALTWAAGDAVTSRIGARLQYTAENGETLWQSYAKANLWHSSGGVDEVRFDASPAIDTRFGNTSLELGAGITAQIGEGTSLYGQIDHRWSVGGNEQQSTTQATVGLRFNW